MLHHEPKGRHGGLFHFQNTPRRIEPREGKTALNVLFYEEGTTKRDFAKRKRIDPPMLHHEPKGRHGGLFYFHMIPCVILCKM